MGLLMGPLEGFSWANFRPNFGLCLLNPRARVRDCQKPLQKGSCLCQHVISSTSDHACSSSNVPASAYARTLSSGFFTVHLRLVHQPHNTRHSSQVHCDIRDHSCAYPAAVTGTEGEIEHHQLGPSGAVALLIVCPPRHMPELMDVEEHILLSQAVSKEHHPPRLCSKLSDADDQVTFASL